MRIVKLGIGLICLMVLLPQSVGALVAGERPGIHYADQVLFLEKKIVADGRVAWITLAYEDPRTSKTCRNFFDVLGGRELFSDIPEKSWLLVDFELRSLVVDSGFSGDADVASVLACNDYATCCRERDRRHAARPVEPSPGVEEKPRQDKPTQGKPLTLDEVGERLLVGRRLVKAARCRGCHTLEGFGADHAPSLTWRRHKYEPNWLADYLAAPYRMRPAMNNLMMLAYTSPNAVPNLQPAELNAVADYLQQLGWMTSPAKDFRLEPWQNYNCFDCHTRLFKEKPLTFAPTSLSGPSGEKTTSTAALRTCVACHAFGDQQTATKLAAPMALAPDLLLAVEKLQIDYLQAYLEDPGYVQPGSQMPRLNLTEQQLLELRQLFKQLKEALAADEIKPVHRYYRMEKESVE
ncbi:MAG: cytochrome c [Desulfuromonadaceae bacterium]|nr:cytochrome c [Desulfuromonadaceae bacterium]